MKKKAFITGVAGQDGSYLSELLLEKGYEVHGMLRRSSLEIKGRISHLYEGPKRNKNFHARFSARMRIYKYIIINRLGRPVLENNRGWHIMKKLDLVAMKKGAKKLIGTKDFSTFRASSCRAKSPIKTMKLVKIKSFENKVEIEFRSQSFLQQQVRSMVGCLKYLGEKKWSIKKFDNVMKSKKRILCAPPAPPEGLYLARIIY